MLHASLLLRCEEFIKGCVLHYRVMVHYQAQPVASCNSNILCTVRHLGSSLDHFDMKLSLKMA